MKSPRGSTSAVLDVHMSKEVELGVGGLFLLLVALTYWSLVENWPAWFGRWSNTRDAHTWTA